MDSSDPLPDPKTTSSKAADIIAARRADARAAAQRNADKLIKGPAATEFPETPTLNNGLFGRLFAWLGDNWFYAISAISLELAGLFLVQYGMGNGLLPPAARVASALVFGVDLIVAGEFIRRRFGEAEDSAKAYLSSVFAGCRACVAVWGRFVRASFV